MFRSQCFFRMSSQSVFARLSFFLLRSSSLALDVISFGKSPDAFFVSCAPIPAPSVCQTLCPFFAFGKHFSLTLTSREDSGIFGYAAFGLLSLLPPSRLRSASFPHLRHPAKPDWYLRHVVMPLTRLISCAIVLSPYLPYLFSGGFFLCPPTNAF